MKEEIVKDKLVITMNDILGNFAKYAVQQSPYNYPENLELALDRIYRHCFENMKERKFDLIYDLVGKKELGSYLRNIISNISIIKDWSIQNPDDENCKLVSQFDSPQDAEDVIDLDELIMNIEHAIIRDYDQRY